LGLRFSVEVPRVRESKGFQTPLADLVQHNALLKAEEVASRVKSGLVIGADTLVLGCQGRLIGKPGSLREARRNLKILFKGPSWVYTGVAVVDGRTGRKQVDYEKTRVFMSPLTEQEIDRYYKKVSPLDKAGGFDIEGKGGLFIRRIEGCYFNVIGLPLAKLHSLLKRFGASLFLGSFLMLGAGCATEYNLATGQQETLLY
jgi:septum formation protein